MKRNRFILRTMSVVAIIVLLLLELAVAWHLSYAKSSKEGDLGPTENGTLQTASVPQLDAPGETGETNSDDEGTEELSAPWEIQIGDYTVKTERITTNDEASAELEVWQGQTLVYQVEGNRFELASDQESDDGTTNAYFEPGANVTGNGIPNLIVTEYSGGAHCCMTYYIFELGGEFRLIDTIPAEHGTIDFQDVDGDGIPEITMSDWSYAYVFGSFASSPAPDIILRYTNGHYEIASDLMQTPAPDAVELQQMADEIKTNYAQIVESDGSNDEWAAETGLWQQMLDLIYGGHEDESLKLFNLAWPQDLDGKEQALTDFVEAVTNSTYWEAMYGVEDATTDAVENVASPTAEPWPSGRQ